ncbi:hypothetical protein ABW19_dt0203179 [Dactylella cylindrospora]|nr:hypothetical protein ABW19_dt0203179 [Dactylella cylindrospora]
MLTRLPRLFSTPATTSILRILPSINPHPPKMDADDSPDLTSLGFTSFGKKPTSHSSLPMHSSHNPLSSLPAKPPPPNPQSQPQSQSQPPYQQNFNPRGGGGGGGGRGGQNFRNRGGPHRSRGFHSQSRGGNFGRGGGGRGGRGGFHHHHPYSHPPQNQQQQQRDFSTSQHSQSAVPSYKSSMFGEGLYKPSMDEDPWKEWGDKPEGVVSGNISSAVAGGSAAGAAGDIWMGSDTADDKSKWYDKEEDKAADGGGWNADEIDLGDDL